MDGSIERAESGAAMVEYSILLACVAVVLVAATRVIGVKVDALFDLVAPWFA